MTIPESLTIKPAVLRRNDGTNTALVFIGESRMTAREAWQFALNILDAIETADARVDYINDMRDGIEVPLSFSKDGATSLECQHCLHKWVSKAKPGNITRCPVCQKNKRIPKGA